MTCKDCVAFPVCEICNDLFKWIDPWWLKAGCESRDILADKMEQALGEVCKSPARVPKEALEDIPPF